MSKKNLHAGVILDFYTITSHQTLDRIARNCPRALSAFIHLMSRADNEGNILLQKSQITDDLSESFVKFKNDLRALARESLLEWHQMGDHLHVTLALPGEMNEGA
jgi:hypothetical protein